MLQAVVIVAICALAIGAVLGTFYVIGWRGGMSQQIEAFFDRAETRAKVLIDAADRELLAYHAENASTRPECFIGSYPL